MTSILFNLSGKIDRPIVDTLHILRKVADSLNIPFFVVGASARDFILKHRYGIEPRRKTGDIDLGVEVASWEQFGKFTDRLSSNPVLDIKLSHLPGLAIMKLVSWKENYPNRKRDAEDVLFMMQTYDEAGNLDRLYEEELALLEDEGFDTRLAGIRLLGRDMRKICDPETFRMIKEILDTETEEMSRYKLVTDMIRETGLPDTRFDEILAQLTKLRQGFVEVGENP